MAQLVRSLERKAIGIASLPSATSFDLEESVSDHPVESNGLELQLMEFLHLIFNYHFGKN